MTAAVTRRATFRPLWLTYHWELEKLAAQFRTRLASAVCLLAPWAFVLGLKATTTVPADTLFGRWVHDSGFAVPLVALGFAGSWVFPLLVCLVAGDVFSSEDHYHTWSTLLTRSVSRRNVFGGKVLAVGTYVVTVVVLLAASSVTSGVVVVGHDPLIGLSGQTIAPSRAVGLVLAAWAGVLPSALAFAALSVLISVLTRNSLAGIVGPTVIGLLLQLLLFVDGLSVIRPALPNYSFVAWHGLFLLPVFVGPVVVGGVLAAGYVIVFLAGSWYGFRRRDFPA